MVEQGDKFRVKRESVCDALAHRHCRLHVQDFCDIQQEVEVSESSVQRLALILGKVTFELGMLGWGAPIVSREVLDLQEVVVTFRVGLTVIHIHDEEKLVELLNVLTTRHDGGDHLIRFGFTNAHLLAVLGLTENSIALKSLSHV